MIIHLKKIEDEKLKEYIEKTYGITVNQNMLEIFQGSIGKAIQLKDKIDDYTKIENIIKNLQIKDIIDIINMSEILYKSKEEIFEILDYIIVILLKLAKQDYKYTDCIKIVENTKKRLKQNANYDMCIDNMVFNMWEEVN